MTDYIKYISFDLDFQITARSSGLGCDETAISLYITNAARLPSKELPESLANAKAIVNLPTPWPKGYYYQGRSMKAQLAIEIKLMCDNN